MHLSMAHRLAYKSNTIAFWCLSLRTTAVTRLVGAHSKFIHLRTDLNHMSPLCFKAARLLGFVDIIVLHGTNLPNVGTTSRITASNSVIKSHCRLSFRKVYSDLPHLSKTGWERRDNILINMDV